MCIFCDIIAGKIPCYKIYEDEHTLAFLDIAKDTFGNTLVVPKVHYDNMLDIPQDKLNQVMATVKKVTKHYATLGYDGFNILNNCGDVACLVGHFHVHIFPRVKGDNKEMDLLPHDKNVDLDKAYSKFKMI